MSDDSTAESGEPKAEPLPGNVHSVAVALRHHMSTCGSRAGQRELARKIIPTLNATPEELAACDRALAEAMPAPADMYFDPTTPEGQEAVARIKAGMEVPVADRSGEPKADTAATTIDVEAAAASLTSVMEALAKETAGATMDTVTIDSVDAGPLTFPIPEGKTGNITSEEFARVAASPPRAVNEPNYARRVAASAGLPVVTPTANQLRAVHGEIWAMHPGRLKALSVTGFATVPTAEQIEARTGPRIGKVKGAVAVIPLTGVITERGGWFEGTSSQKWGAAFDDLIARSDVGAIVIDVDSPGGTCAGTPELAAKIFAARGTKPIIAVANSWAASAAYFIASAADELVVTPSGDVGSIGVISMHTDWSDCDAAMGVKTTIITAGKYKAETNPFEPLSKEAREEIQRSVDRHYEMFVSAVARHRKTTASVVKRDFGQGRLVGAKEAVSLGMADRVGTLEETIQRLGGSLSERAEITRQAAARQREIDLLELEG